MLHPEDLRIFYAFELDATRSATEVARDLGLKPARVHRVIRRLIAEQIVVGKTIVLDLSRVGLFEWGLNLKTEFKSATQRQNFEKYLLGLKSVSWLAACGGKFSYLCTVIAPTPHQALHSIEKIIQVSNGCISDRETFVRTERRRYWALTEKTKSTLPRLRYHLGSAPGSEEVGKTDKLVLEAFHNLPFWSYRDIAQQAGVSLGAVLRTVERLREKKIYLGAAYRLDREKIGIMQFRLLLRLTNPDEHTRKNLLNVLSEVPSVRLITSVFGAWDSEVSLDVASYAEMTAAVDLIRQRTQSQIQASEIIPVYRQLKLVSFPMIGGPLREQQHAVGN